MTVQFSKQGKKLFFKYDGPRIRKKVFKKIYCVDNIYVGRPNLGDYHVKNNMETKHAIHSL